MQEFAAHREGIGHLPCRVMVGEVSNRHYSGYLARQLPSAGIWDWEGARMSQRKSLVPQWAIDLGPDFLNSLDPLLSTDDFVASGHTREEKLEKTPQQILTEMGVTSVIVDSAEDMGTKEHVCNFNSANGKAAISAAISDLVATFRARSHHAYSVPVTDTRGALSPSQVASPAFRPTISITDSNPRNVHPQAAPGPQRRCVRGSTKTWRSGPHHRFGVRFLVISIAFICLTFAVSWHGGQSHPANLKASASGALVSGKTDVPSQPSPNGPPSSMYSTNDSFAPAPAKIQMVADIPFAFDSSELDERSKNILDGIIGRISMIRQPVVELHGYSDSIGTPDYNRDLSEKRARAVRDYMVGSGRLNHISIKVVGHGSERTVAPTTVPGGTDPTLAANRRVEVLMYGSSITSGHLQTHGPNGVTKAD